LDPGDPRALIAVTLSRSAERVLPALAGASAIYLGYRLFLAIPAADKSDGRISLPEGVSIFLTRLSTCRPEPPFRRASRFDCSLDASFHPPRRGRASGKLAIGMKLLVDLTNHLKRSPPPGASI
jgi:hypothetical protein